MTKLDHSFKTQNVYRQNTTFIVGQLNRGFTILEVLVAMVIFTIGLLGLAGLQLVGLRDTKNIYSYNQAVNLTNEMAERIHSNSKVWGGLNTLESIWDQAPVDCDELCSTNNCIVKDLVSGLLKQESCSVSPYECKKWSGPAKLNFMCFRPDSCLVKDINTGELKEGLCPDKCDGSDCFYNCNEKNLAKFDYCVWRNKVQDELGVDAQVNVLISPILGSNTCNGDSSMRCLITTWPNGNADNSKFEMEITP